MQILKRGLMALGLMLALATISSAQAPQVGGAAGDDGTGWAPRIKAIINSIHYADGCRCGQSYVGGPSKGRVPPPRTQPGTVVFPQHPFVRGPRDFFMMD